MLDGLLPWLRAQIDEDEKVASAIFRDHTWAAYLEGGTDGWAVEGAHSGEPGCVVGDEAMAAHISRFDPKRMLDEVAAKRRIVRECESQAAWESTTGRKYPATTAWALAVTTLRVLALPYAERPGYQESWRP